MVDLLGVVDLRMRFDFVLVVDVARAPGEVGMALGDIILVMPGLVIAPGVVAPGVIEPGPIAPGVVAPGMAEPGVMEPGVMEPGVIEPGVMAPGAVVAAPGEGAAPVCAKAGAERASAVTAASI